MTNKGLLVMLAFACLASASDTATITVLESNSLAMQTTSNSGGTKIEIDGVWYPVRVGRFFSITVAPGDHDSPGILNT